MSLPIYLAGFDGMIASCRRPTNWLGYSETCGLRMQLLAYFVVTANSFARALCHPALSTMRIEAWFDIRSIVRVGELPCRNLAMSVSLLNTTIVVTKHPEILMQSLEKHFRVGG